MHRTPIKLQTTATNPPNKAVVHDTISDICDSNPPNTQVDAQGAGALKERIDNSKEHTPRVAPCEDNQKHIKMISHDAGALEKTGLVDLDNAIGHEDDGPSFFLIILFN